jgi:putative copper resistance protein D
VHLLSGGFWIGCLVPLLICLPQLRNPAQRPDAALALRRFSSLGHVAVALILATGLINTGLILRKLPVDFSSPYETLLAAKIGLVGMMVAIAIINRYIVVPRLWRGQSPFDSWS